MDVEAKVEVEDMRNSWPMVLHNVEIAERQDTHYEEGGV